MSDGKGLSLEEGSDVIGCTLRLIGYTQAMGLTMGAGADTTGGETGWGLERGWVWCAEESVP